MKIAVLADIHGFYEALEVVAEHIDAWQPDLVVVAGDIINRGPDSRRCWEYVAGRRDEAGWQVIYGNHEEYVLAHAEPGATRSGPRFELFRMAYWTLAQIGPAHTAAVRALPFAFESFNGRAHPVLRVTHASDESTRHGIYPDTHADELAERIHTPRPDVFVVGHTHRALVRQFGDTLVANTGSVGQPFDHDPRATYAQITHSYGRWQARIVRLDVDRQAIERRFVESGQLGEAGALARVFHREWQLCRPVLPCFMRDWEQPIMDGRVTVDAAVDAFLRQVGPP